MKMQRTVLLVVGLAALQGGCRSGTWFPRADQPVRKQTYWDTPRPRDTCTSMNPWMRTDVASRRDSDLSLSDHRRSVDRDRR